jgi:hypothetical protein
MTLVENFRRLRRDLENASVDVVVSFETIEHIPDDGDSVAIREIARVLAPGGLACLTVPWSDRGYLEEFKRRGDPDAYWVPGDGDRVFFQRLYDRDTLERRLLRPSGLSLVDLSFWGERTLPVEHVILNRPEVRNAFNEEVIAELTAWAAATRQAAEMSMTALPSCSTCRLWSRPPRVSYTCRNTAAFAGEACVGSQVRTPLTGSTLMPRGPAARKKNTEPPSGS